MTPLEVLTLHALKAATLSVVAWQCRCGVSWDEYSGTHAQHQWAQMLIELDITRERRVMTPQGTSRPVTPNEQLGGHPSSWGWWIEGRYLTSWECE